MSGRIRGATVALGLIATLLCALAQAFAQTPEGARIPESRPAPEAQTDSRADGVESEAGQFTVPVRVLEDPEEAQRREAREQRAEEREQADLEAQRGMAESTREMLGLAWWQVGLAFLGAVLLGTSLIYSAKATRAAADAATAAQEVLKAERAWVTFAACTDLIHTNLTVNDMLYPEAVGFKIFWVNSGRSPALHVKIHADIKAIPIGSDAPAFDLPKFGPEGMTIGPTLRGEGPQLPVYGEEYRGFMNRTTQLFAYSRVEYVDVFNLNTIRISEICICIRYEGERIDDAGRSHPSYNMAILGGIYNSCT